MFRLDPSKAESRKRFVLKAEWRHFDRIQPADRRILQQFHLALQPWRRASPSALLEVPRDSMRTHRGGDRMKHID